MERIRKIFSFILVFTILITPSLILANNNENLDFDEYGFRLNSNKAVARSLASRNVSWETFPSKTNVPLDKMWTIEFSHTVTMDKIDAVVIEQGNQYIPVTISKTANNKLVVSPRDKFAGNTDYVLKILLNNGRRYKMNFRTRNSNRNADIEPNNTYLDASRLYLNETIDGEITKGDVDFYKIEVPYYGTLNVNLTSLNNTRMGLYLYGPNGNNNSYMKSRTNFTQGGISEGLMPGTYYIRVSTYSSSAYSPYELEVDFKESNLKDDNGASNYLKSETIDLNSSFTGHIGYFSDYNYGNYNDFFKIEVPREGTLNIDLTSYNNKGLSLFLYGSEGDNRSYIRAKSNFTQGGISETLQPGTYYIKVTTYYSSDYAPYKLDLKFN